MIDAAKPKIITVVKIVTPRSNLGKLKTRLDLVHLIYHALLLIIPIWNKNNFTSGT